MAKDGLWDVYNDFGMAICAEICADQHKITREQQVTVCCCEIFLNVFYPLVVWNLNEIYQVGLKIVL